jgi:hypothetical protein
MFPNNYFEDICAYTSGYRVKATLVNFYDLLNHKETVLLPIKEDSKAPEIKNWQKLTYADTQVERYQRALDYALHNTAIGVQLGNGIHAIDVDSDELAEQFLTLNPLLANTLRTRGSRGCQLWVKIDGECPEKVHPLKLADGKQVGEWRSRGGQSIIFGNHPSGNRYSYPKLEQPITIKFADIRWPIGWVLPWDPTTKPKTKTQRKKEDTDQKVADKLRKRIEGYIATVPGAVEGQGGDAQTYSVACALTHGFALSANDAMVHMRLYNQKCVPPWSEEDLQRKIDESIKATDHQKSRGHLLGTNNSGLPEVILPGIGRNESSFARDISKLLPKQTLFRKSDFVVEVTEPEKSECELGHSDQTIRFQTMTPRKFTTWVEQYVTTGVVVAPKDDVEATPRFVECSMRDVQAAHVLEGPIFSASLPSIDRILDVPIPIRVPSGDVVYPKVGYNERLRLFCDPKSQRSIQNQPVVIESKPATKLVS